MPEWVDDVPVGVCPDTIVHSEGESEEEEKSSDDDSAYLRGRDYECPYCFTPNPGGNIGELTHCGNCENYYPCGDDNDTGHDF